MYLNLHPEVADDGVASRYRLLSLHTVPCPLSDLLSGQVLRDGIPLFLSLFHHLWADLGVAADLGSGEGSGHAGQ